MSETSDRKRLTQKMLERWENEGGKIEVAQLASEHVSYPTRNRRKLSHLSSPSSRENSNVRTLSGPSGEPKPNC